MKKPIYKILHKQMVEHLKDEWVYDSKGIGFFSSITVAERVIERYRKIAGFCDCPKGFVVNKYMVDFHRKKRRNFVFVLEHSYEDESGYDIVTEPWIFSTMSEAENQMKKAIKEFPFCDHPDDFLISEYKLNKCEWTEGFKSNEKAD